MDIYNHLGFSKSYLKKIADEINYHYLSFPIRKKNGKVRWIDAPDEELKKIQYAILHRILYKFRPHKCAVGFIKKRSVLYGASQHLGAHSLLTVDIKDFFPSITIKYVRNVWRFLFYILAKKDPFPYKEDDINIINTLTTYMGALPQGAPTSPALANLYCIDLDKRLVKIAEEYNLVYTRYADDITLSSYNKLFNLTILETKIGLLLHTYGFLKNDAKYRILKSHQRMLVTGVVINKIPGVPKYKWRNLRAKLHNLVVSGEQISKETYDKLRGQIEWITSLHPSRGEKLLTELGRIPLKI